MPKSKCNKLDDSTRERLHRAIQAHKDGKGSIRSLAKEYSVNRCTLAKSIARGGISQGPGRPPALSHEQREEVKEQLIRAEASFKPLGQQQLTTLIGCLASNTGFKTRYPAREYLRLFLKKQPDIRRRTENTLSPARLNAITNPTNYIKFYKHLLNAYQSFPELEQECGRIFNVDE